MTFTIHSWIAADGAELRYGLLTSSNDASLKSPRRGLVFVPGLGGSVKNSLVFFNALLEHFSPIVVPDLRGFGLNEGLALPNPKQFVTDLTHFLGHISMLSMMGDQSWTLGGISLGGCVVSHTLGAMFQQHLQTTGLDSLWLLASAVQEHPNTFKLSYVAHILWTLATHPKTLIKLPYGLEALTQNPAVLASEQYQQHMENFKIPAKFLWQLRAFNRSSIKAMRTISCPVHFSIPLADRIICPQAMQRAFHQLPPNVLHQCHQYEGLYHDAPLELGMRDVVADVAAWFESLETHKSYSLLKVTASVV